ncbi:MAG TPA: tetratricopeptide repeat protein [Spirochaetota bacterium]|nr:tetratricopeptide repeat protein [Spirochaetota bacterium]
MKQFLCAILIIFSLITSASASYKDALKLFDAGKYQESLNTIASELKIADDMTPDSPNYKLRFLAAHNHWKLASYNSAILHFQRCMQIRKDSPDPYIDLALMLYDIKKYNDSLVYVKKGLEIKQDPMLYYVYGKLAYHYKNYLKAKEFFEKSISLDPELYVSYNSLGMTFIELNNYSNAYTAFSAASVMSPGSHEIFNNLGYSLEKMEKYPDAMKYYEKALLLQPENNIIQANLARVKLMVSK